MEDPIQFSLWGKPTQKTRKRVEAMLAAAWPDEPRVNILRIVKRALATDTSVCFADSLGWSDTQKIRDNATELFSEIQVFQAGYGPDDEDSMSMCDVHSIFYGGCLGCPICDNTHEP